jgi:hypothetical protein
MELMSKMKTRHVVSALARWFFFCGFLFSSHSDGQEKAYFETQKREVIRPSTVVDGEFSITPSPNNTAISTLFDRFSVNLQSKTDPLNGSSFVGFRVPVNAVIGEKYIYYTQDIRGVIHKDADARVILVLDLGGHINTIEYPYGKKIDINLSLNFPQRVINSGTVNHAATLGIVAERKTAEDAVFAQIDSLDLSVSVKKNKPK